MVTNRRDAVQGATNPMRHLPWITETPKDSSEFCGIRTTAEDRNQGLASDFESQSPKGGFEKLFLKIVGVGTRRVHRSGDCRNR